MLRHERKLKGQGFDLVVGLDEAGRGPLAGPVVASAVALRRYDFLTEIRDSKKLTPRMREKAFLEILTKAYVGIGMANENVIDSVNILQATFLAMTNAVRHLIANLPKSPVSSGRNTSHKIYLLVDGNRFVADLPYPFLTIVQGEDASLSIACASIVAKVVRDRILNIYDKIFPRYGFSQHKGYPTDQHRTAIHKFGLCPIHRKTFQCFHETSEE